MVLGYLRIVLAALATAVFVGFYFLYRRIYGYTPVVLHRHVQSWARTIVRLAGTRVSIVEQAIRQGSRPRVYIANHRSLFDIPVALASIAEPIVVIYKAELDRIPVLGHFLRTSPYVAVDRSDPASGASSTRALLRSLRDGVSVLMFPEGTWSYAREILPFKSGAFLLAHRFVFPVVPMAISGTEKVVKPDTYYANPGRVAVKFGSEILPLAHEGIESFQQECYDRLVALLKQVET